MNNLQIFANFTFVNLFSLNNRVGPLIVSFEKTFDLHFCK